MRSLVLHPLARADIRNVLARTLSEYGVRQYERYESLIEDALTTITERPDRGHPCVPPFEHLLRFRIARRGRRARHFVLYRVTDRATELLRFLDDAVEVPRHLIDEWKRS